MMEAARTSETSVDIYLTTRQYIPEDSELCSKISSSLFTIKRISNLVDSDGLLSVHHGIVHPLLSYGVMVWGHRARTYTKRVCTLQKKVVSCIASLKPTVSCWASFISLDHSPPSSAEFLKEYEIYLLSP
jgi:hypothetical protein